MERHHQHHHHDHRQYDDDNVDNDDVDCQWCWYERRLVNEGRCHHVDIDLDEPRSERKRRYNELKTAKAKRQRQLRHMVKFREIKELLINSRSGSDDHDDGNDDDVDVVDDDWFPEIPAATKANTAPINRHRSRVDQLRATLRKNYRQLASQKQLIVQTAAQAIIAQKPAMLAMQKLLKIEWKKPTPASPSGCRRQRHKKTGLKTGLAGRFEEPDQGDTSWFRYLDGHDDFYYYSDNDSDYDPDDDLYDYYDEGRLPIAFRPTDYFKGGTGTWDMNQRLDYFCTACAVVELFEGQYIAGEGGMMWLPGDIVAVVAYSMCRVPSYTCALKKLPEMEWVGGNYRLRVVTNNSIWDIDPVEDIQLRFGDSCVGNNVGRYCSRQIYNNDRYWPCSCDACLQYTEEDRICALDLSGLENGIASIHEDGLLSNAGNMRFTHIIFGETLRRLTEIPRRFPADAEPQMYAWGRRPHRHSRFFARAPTVLLGDCSNVSVIGNGFLEYSQIEAIDLSPLRSVVTIGDMFLRGCHRLKELDLSHFDQVTEIGSDFLALCGDHLLRIDLIGLENVGVIKDRFLQHSMFTQIDLSPLKKVTKIGSEFMGGCLNLSTVDLQHFHMLEEIGDNFLYNCPNIKKISTAPLACKLQGVGSNFLSNCDCLRHVDLKGFKDVRVIEDGFLQYCTNLNLENIDLSPLRNVVKIRNDFLRHTWNRYYCSITTTISFRDLTQLQEVGDKFLAGSSKLLRVDLRGFEKVTTIGDGFLEDCRRLESVDLSPLQKVVTIGRDFLAMSPNRDYWDEEPSLKAINLQGLGNVTVIRDRFLFGTPCSKRSTSHR